MVDSVVVVRCFEDALVLLRNGDLTRFTVDGKSVERVELVDYPRVAADVFGMPNLPIDEALPRHAGKSPSTCLNEVAAEDSDGLPAQADPVSGDLDVHDAAASGDLDADHAVLAEAALPVRRQTAVGDR